jgi:hypothetical protein
MMAGAARHSTNSCVVEMKVSARLHVVLLRSRWIDQKHGAAMAISLAPRYVAAVTGSTGGGAHARRGQMLRSTGDSGVGGDVGDDI